MEYSVTALYASKVFDVMTAASELPQQKDVLLTLEKTDAKGGRNSEASWKTSHDQLLRVILLTVLCSSCLLHKSVALHVEYI